MDDAVTQYLAEAVDKGRLLPGGRLPTEREFTEVLDLPRSAVRRALAGLEREGRVVRHVGRGTFLADVTPSTTPAEAMTSPGEFMNTRLVFEPEVAFHAARNATTADLRAIEAAMLKGSGADSYDEFEGWDSIFHRAIADAVHNHLLSTMFETMNVARELPIWGTSKRRHATAERRRSYEAQHEELFAALTDRNPTEARSAMTRHLESVRTNLLGTPDGS
ncbi:FadR/GntR family transcriptional regulator [Frondihabitans sp. 762G35]|uniref:FadR/GntR family transcriptional regulator n=1 Tax=Frondihabitans sp. 762G35 TaxID=1446794 RepID=UPI000E7062EE|nr:FCD domain-containing protein [Frondihabitans sp. 762G35]